MKWNAAAVAIVAAAVIHLCSTHFWIELIDTTDSIVYVATLNGSSDDHSVEDAVGIDKRFEPALLAEAVGCIFVSFYDEVVHHKSIEIPVVCKQASHLCQDVYQWRESRPMPSVNLAMHQMCILQLARLYQ